MTGTKHNRRKKRTPWARRLRRTGQVLAAIPGMLLGFTRALIRKVTSRDFLAALLCLPALLTVAGVVWMVLEINHTSQGSAARYKRAAQAATAAKNTRVAELYFLKLLYLDETDPEPRFELALIADARGEKQHGERLMQQIAPSAEVGYAPAHFWLVQKRIDALSLEKSPPSPKEIADIQGHLRYVIAREPRHLEARAMLGQICLQTGSVNEAITHLSVAAAAQPPLHLTLAQLCSAQGNKNLAELHGKAARDYFQAQLTARPGDIETELGLAAAELSLGNTPRALEVLSKGLERTNDARFHLGLTGAYLMSFDQVNPKEVARRLELIEKAWTHGPDSLAVLTRLQQLAGGSGPEARQARNAIEKSLEMGKAPAVAHFLLGSMDVNGGNLTAARSHFEDAHRLDPENAQTANNLAWLLANSEPYELARALQLAADAVTAFPAQANFRETRGQILAKLGRYKEAVTDLELALSALSQMPSIHAALAKAYEALGDTELAARHRELSATKTAPKDE